MQAKSLFGKSVPEIEAALQQYLQQGDASGTQAFRPTLAVVFMSIRHNRKAICEILNREGIEVFGATSCGEFTDGFQQDGAIAMLLLDIPKSCFALLYEEIGERTVEEAARHMAMQANNTFNNPGLILCSTGMNTQGEFFDGTALVQSMRNTLGHNVSFFGGMAGDDMTFTGTYIFNGVQETDYGILALVLDADRISMQGIAITGWKPMGISRTVTKSMGNLVYAFDDRPAIDMYLHYLGKKDVETGNAYQLMNEVSMHYPFIVERAGGGTFLHTPLSIDEKENALVLDVAMPEGTKFWFAVPPDFEIVEEIVQEAERIRQGSHADALLIFSCAGRLNVLGPLTQSENEGLHETWQAPMAGFFTYGEYGRDEKGNQEFHSGACSWVALKEKKSIDRTERQNINNYESQIH